MTATILSEELRKNLEQVRRNSPVITTLANGKPNWIVSVSEHGVLIETESSKRKGKGPQLVKAEMITTAWDYLRVTRSLTYGHLVSSAGLNVKRSSAVCALLARLPGVSVASTRPIELHYRAPA